MKRCVLWLLLAPLTACAPLYQAQPIDSASNITQITAQHIDNADFKAYAQAQLTDLSWPIQTWDLHRLTVAALYFHPSLKVAKSDYAVALAGIENASLKPMVGLNTNLDRSNQANGDISPWAYGLQVNLPIITANKRQINIEVARQQAEIARIAIAETAWQLRTKLSLDLVVRAELQAQLESLRQLQSAQSALLQAIEKRLAVGVAANSDVLQVRLHFDQINAQIEQLTLQLQQNMQTIVHDAGLSAENLPVLNIEPLSLSTLDHPPFPELGNLSPQKWIQHQALTNRMDIQRALAQYAKAEAQLKLQMAKRYPDIALSPGILYEYGDRIWALGIGGVFNLLNKTSSLWVQAEQVRDNEAKRFYALQQQLIQQSEQRYLTYRQAKEYLATLQSGLMRQQQRLTQLEHQWRAGLLDKTEWLQAKIQYQAANQRVVNQQAAVVLSLLEIENFMQRPFVFQTAMPR